MEGLCDRLHHADVQRGELELFWLAGDEVTEGDAQPVTGAAVRRPVEAEGGHLVMTWQCAGNEVVMGW